MAASFVDLAQPQAGASVMESEAVQQPRVTYPHRWAEPARRKPTRQCE